MSDPQNNARPTDGDDLRARQDAEASGPSDQGSPAADPFVGGGTVVLPPDELASSAADSDRSANGEGSRPSLPPGQNAVYAQTMQVQLPEDTSGQEPQIHIAEVAHRTAVVPLEERPADDSAAAGPADVFAEHVTPPTAQPEGSASGDDSQEASAYELLSRIGEGGMGAIYLARQTALNREVAIKTLKPLTAEEKDARGSVEKVQQAEARRREMFLSEALVTANLVHPHIVPIHDLSQDDPSSPFYVMKRIKGTPWHERLLEMPLPDNLEVLLKVCDAVAYAHHRGVVNRDLKPENVMLGEFGEVLVLDWGLATPTGQTRQIKFQSMTASYGAGTPAYMAPELWNGPADRIGPWSDVYLLGATLFEIVTGKPPHKFPDPPHGTSGTALWSIIDRVVRINQIRETDAQGELFDIAMKAMSYDPADRYGSVVEFQNAIRDYQRHQESLHLSERADQLLLADRRQPEAAQRQHESSSLKGEEWTGPERRSGKDRRESYREYQAATTLYEEAYNAWPDNTAAREGLRKARLEYATLAHAKGDYDLGLQIAVLESGTEFAALKKKLQRARSVRQGIRSVAMVAVAAIILLGIFSTAQAIRISRQKDAIVALAGTRESLTRDNAALQSQKAEAQRQKQEAIKLADAARIDQARAVKQRAAAVQQRAAAVAEQKAAEAALAAADDERRKVEAERDLAEEALETAEAARIAALDAQRTAETEKKQALKQTELASRQKAEAEASLQRISGELKQLDAEKARAEVELRNTQIGSLVRNADYAAAVQRIEKLIAALQNDPALQQLPADERQQRAVELKARLRQLQRRTLQTQAAVQTQLIDRENGRLIWGDVNGRLTVRALPAEDDQFAPKVLQTAQVDGPVVQLVGAPDRRSILVAAGTAVWLWRPDLTRLTKLTTHGAPVSAIGVWNSAVLSADEAGDIKATATTAEEATEAQWSIRGAAEIRDLLVLQQSGILLSAASRGGESADVVAWQLSSDPDERPARLGQLRFPRNQIDPPLKLAAAPDESLLVLSNARNGGLWLLPRQTDAASSKGFPYQHAADLAQQAWTAAEGPHHRRPVNDLSFSQDGRRLVTASDDRNVFVWEIDGGRQTDVPQLRLLRQLQGHGARVLSAEFLDHAGEHVSSTAADRYCRLWDVQTAGDQQQKIERLFQLVNEPSVTNVAVERRATAGAAAKSRFVLTGLPDQSISTTESLTLNVGSLQLGAIRALCFSSDGTRLATGAADGSTVVWDAVTGQPITRDGSDAAEVVYRDGHAYNISSLAFVPPFGQIAMTTGYDGSLCLWDADPAAPHPGRELARVDGLGLVNAAAVSPDGTLIATTWAGDDGSGRNVAVWRVSDLLNATASQPIRFLNDYHRQPVSAVCFSPNGRRIATAGRDGRIAVWDSRTGVVLAAGQPHTSRTLVRQLAWLNDQAFLSAGFDGRLLQLTWSTGQSDAQTAAANSDAAEPAVLEVAVTYEHDDSPLEQLSLSSDATQFVTLSRRTRQAVSTTETLSSQAQLWRVGQSTAASAIHPARIPQQPASDIRSVAWSQLETQILLTVGSTLQLVDAETLRIDRVLQPNRGELTFATFAAHGRDAVHRPHAQTTIGTFHQRTARLWNLHGPDHVASLQPPATVLAVALTSGPEPHLITGARSLRLFDATRGSPQHGRTVAKVFQPHATPIRRLATAPHDSTFVSCGTDGIVKIWNAEPQLNEIIAVDQFDAGPGLPVQLEYADEGHQLKSVSRDGKVQIYQPDRAEAVVRIECPLADAESLCADFHPTQPFVVLAGRIRETQESVAQVFRIDQDQLILHCTIEGHEAGGITATQFLPDSDHLVTTGADGRVLIWNWQPQREAATAFQAYEAYEFLTVSQPRAHRGSVTALSVSPTGRIATSSSDGAATIWQNPFRIRN